MATTKFNARHGLSVGSTPTDVIDSTGLIATTSIPSLDAAKITSGTIDAARLPSYVDDVVEYVNLAGFPGTGETGKIYVAQDTNKTYRWSGSAYVYITSGAVDSVGGYTGVVTAANLLDAIKNVDGTNSGLDADLLDGNSAAAFYLATNPSGYTTNTGTVTGVTSTAPVASSGGTAPVISMAAASAGVDGYMTGAYATKLDGIASGATANAGTVTSVTATAGTGISITGSPITTSGTLTITNSAPDQTVVFTNGTGISITGTYPNFTVTNTSTAVGDVTLTGTQTLSNKTLSSPVISGSITEGVFTITDGASVDLDPANGTIQLWTLGANRTATATNFTAGEAMTLMVADNLAYTLTFPTMTWANGVTPVLATTGYTVVELWKVGSTLYGAVVGDVA